MNEWNESHSVLIQAIDDNVDEYSSSVNISISFSSDDPVYDKIQTIILSFDVIDNDVAGIYPSPANLRLAEGISVPLNIILLSQPIYPVNITLAQVLGGSISNSVDPFYETFERNNFVAIPSFVVFNASNWNVTRTVLIFGVDDQIDEGDEVQYLLNGSVDSEDTKYKSIQTSVNVVIEDNDFASFILSSNFLVNLENGGVSHFSIILTSEPTDQVTVIMSAELTFYGRICVLLLPSEISFSTTNWNEEQTIEVVAVDNFVDEGITYVSDIEFQIFSSDSMYLNTPVGYNLTIEIVNDDRAGLSITSALQIEEGYDGKEILINLDSEPVSNVILSVFSICGASSNLNICAEKNCDLSPQLCEPYILDIQPDSLLVSPTTWNETYISTISPVSDHIARGELFLLVNISVSIEDEDSLEQIFQDVTASCSIHYFDNDRAGVIENFPAEPLQTHEGAVGCDGVPNSGAYADACGRCGGWCSSEDNDENGGCDSIGSAYDYCGVCGGDSSSCVYGFGVFKISLQSEPLSEVEVQFVHASDPQQLGT